MAWFIDRFSQRIMDDAVYVEAYTVDADGRQEWKVIQGSDAALQANAAADGRSTWLEMDCCALYGLEMPMTPMVTVPTLTTIDSVPMDPMPPV